MTNKVTFLHVADLHLGAPMRGFRDLSDEWVERLQAAIPEAYERVIDEAVSRSVDFAIIAGDVFDTSSASYGDHLRFFEGLEKLDEAGIPSYIVLGNHDPFTKWRSDVSRLPAFARVLGVGEPEFALYERAGEALCLIGGRSYQTQAWPVEESIAHGITRAAAVQALSKENPSALEAPFMVGIVHTGLDLDESKAAMAPDELLAADVDYWACGHLHKRLVRPSEDNPRIAFPGCIQGRDLKESGERGCYFVTLEEGKPPAVEFFPTASVVFHTLRIDVGVCRTIADVARHIQSELFRLSGMARCENMVVRVVLVGETELHRFFTKREVADDLRKRINNSYPSFFCDAVVDNTRPPRDRAALKRGGLFAAQALRVAEHQRSDEEEMINYVQSEFVKRGVNVPSTLAQDIAERAERAELLVLDLLEGDDE